MRHLGRPRSLTVVVATIAALVVPFALNANDFDRGPGRGIDQPNLREAAMDLESKISDHLWYGQIFGARFDSADKLPGHVVGLDGGGDSALWTGVYLAAESFRYAVAKHALATAKNHGHEVLARKEMAAAKARIDQMVPAAHLKINISRNWKGTSSHPTDYGYQAGPDGEAGILFRNCFPQGVAPGFQTQANPRHRQIFGPIPWDGEVMPWETGVSEGESRPYFCEDAASRDMHAGTTFGLLAALDLVGPDDLAMRNMIATDLMTLTDYLYRHGWSVVKPYTRAETAGSELGPVFPLFVINPQPRLNMTQAARHAAQVAGSDVDKAKWEAIWREELASQAPNLRTEYLLAIDSPHNSYYNFNLNHLTNFNVIRLEPDSTVKEEFKRDFSIIDASIRDDINAHFETITYALTGEQERSDAAVQHLEEWLIYRSLADEEVNQNSPTRCTLPAADPLKIACVPTDQTEYIQDTPTGPVSTFRQGAPPRACPSSCRARDPLPITERTKHHDFLWQRSPYELRGGSERNPTAREPGVDFLIPYWMLRYYTEVAPPLYAPFPAWAGVRTR